MGGLFEWDRSSLCRGLIGRTHRRGDLTMLHELCCVQPTTLVHLNKLITMLLGGHSRDLAFGRVQYVLFLTEEDGVTIRGKHNISEDVIQIQRRGGALLCYGRLGRGRHVGGSEHRGWYIWVRHGDYSQQRRDKG